MTTNKRVITKETGFRQGKHSLNINKAREATEAGKGAVWACQRQYSGPLNLDLDLVFPSHPAELPTLRRSNVKVWERDPQIHTSLPSWSCNTPRIKTQYDGKIVQHHCLVVPNQGPKHFMNRLRSDMVCQSRSPGSQLPKCHTFLKANSPACLWILHEGHILNSDVASCSLMDRGKKGNLIFWKLIKIWIFIHSITYRHMLC